MAGPLKRTFFAASLDFVVERPSVNTQFLRHRYVYLRYCMSKKSLPISYSKLPYEMGQEILNIQHVYFALRYLCYMYVLYMH